MKSYYMIQNDIVKIWNKIKKFKWGSREAPEHLFYLSFPFIMMLKFVCNTMYCTLSSNP